MRFVTTDPRSAGFADRVGAVISYVAGGTVTTLVKVGPLETDWAAVNALLVPSPMESVRCPAVSSDPRTGGGRVAQVGDVVLFHSGGDGTYLVKFGAGDTDWVALPDASGAGGGVSLPIAQSDVTGLVSALAGKSPTGHGHAVFTDTDNGFVPAPNNGGDSSKFLAADGSWLSPVGAGAIGFFGLAVDGSATMDGTTTVAGMTPVGGVYTASRSYHFNHLTVNSGVEFVAGGFPVFAFRTTNNGRITGNGAPSTGSPGGGGGGVAFGSYFLRGGNGGNGSNGGGGASTLLPNAGPLYTASGAALQGPINTNASAGDVSCRGGGGGGNSGTAGGNSGSTALDVSSNGGYDLTAVIKQIRTATSLAKFSAGSGGGAAQAAGGGGGGGLLWWASRLVDGAGSFEAKGGNGFSPASDSGGGGGGGGGRIIFIYGSKSGVTFDVSGGSGGTGFPGRGNGGAGADGVVELYNMSGDGT
jgi:hypothetical protein